MQGWIRRTRFAIGLLLLHFAALQTATAADEYQVVVSDPYLELHTGPGRGYPVFYVIDRGLTAAAACAGRDDDPRACEKGGLEPFRLRRCPHPSRLPHPSFPRRREPSQVSERLVSQ